MPQNPYQDQLRFQHLEQEIKLTRELLRDLIILTVETYECFPPEIKELPQVQKFFDTMSRIRLHLDLKENLRGPAL
jgi:hypothetical protein